MEKTVSVVMATYNGEAFLRQQMDSILAQTYPIHELIIQDDGSTDGTVAIVREYAAHHPNIHLFINPHNLGYNENFRTATLRATGDFVAISDQDDIWFPNKLERQVHAIGSCDMCYAPHLKGETPGKTHLVDYPNAAERQMFKAIVGHSMLLTRRYAQDPSVWIPHLAFDIGLSIFAHFRGGVAHVDEPLNFHRQHAQSVTSAQLYQGPQQNPTWQPYLYGIRNYRNIQQQAGFQTLYQAVWRESKSKNPLVERLCELLLNRRASSLLRLCLVCMKHRATIYPTPTHGFKGILRGFCFPFIHAYHCNFYDYVK